MPGYGKQFDDDGNWSYIQPPGPSYRGQATMQVINSAFNIPYPIAYGYVNAIGNCVLMGELPDKSKVVFTLLGTGPWDGVERFWINKAPAYTYQFHPGVLPALGSGLTPSSTGGDNNVDTLFDLLPSSIQRVTFPRTAYVAFTALPDPNAPSPDVQWLGHYRALKVRIFDASGTQTAFQWSLNPVWQWIDLYLRLEFGRELLPGEEPPTSVKNRFDFSAASAQAAYCDELLANGKPRFISSFAWTDTKQLSEMESQLLMSCRGRVTEPQGKLRIRIDKPRTSTFSMSGTHVRSVSRDFHEKSLEGAKNRLIGKFRDLNPIVVANISSISSDAEAIVTVVTTTPHPFAAASAVTIAGTGVTAWDKDQGIIDAVDDTHFRFRPTTPVYSTTVTGLGTCSTPESQFAERSVIMDHNAHQLAIGVGGVGIAAQARAEDITYDFGVSTWDQVWRNLKYMITRSLGVDTTPYKAPMEASLVCDLYGVDVNDHALLAQELGDVISLDATVASEFADDYELKNTTESYLPSGGSEGDAGTIALDLQEYIAEAFTDVSDEAPTLTPAAQGTGLSVPMVVDPSGQTRLTRVQVQTGAATNPLSSTDNGTNATISVAAHSAQTPKGLISYASGSLVGNYSTTYYVYADDSDFSGGTVTYLKSTSKLDPISAEGYYYVGALTTVASGGGGGTIDPPPCTIEGTVLQTDRGPMLNQEIKRLWDADKTCIRLESEAGDFEEIENFEWVEVDDWWWAAVSGFTGFGCSRWHTFKTPAHEKIGIFRLPRLLPVHTKRGWRAIRFDHRKGRVRVAHITLKGPSKTYWVVEGVWSHNLKPGGG